MMKELEGFIWMGEKIYQKEISSQGLKKLDVNKKFPECYCERSLYYGIEATIVYDGYFRKNKRGFSLALVEKVDQYLTPLRIFKFVFPTKEKTINPKLALEMEEFLEKKAKELEVAEAL